MRTHWWFAFLIVLATGVAAFTACSKVDPRSTGEDVAAAQAVTTQQAGTLTQIKGNVNGLTPANVTAQKPVIAGQVNTAISQNQQIGKDLGLASKAAAKDAAVIAASNDPVKVRLEYTGGTLLVLGTLSLVAGFFFSVYLGSWAYWLRSGGAAGIVAGFLVLFLAKYLGAILASVFWISTILVGIGLLAGGVWVYLHRSSLIPGIEAWFKSAEDSAQNLIGTVKKDVA